MSFSARQAALVTALALAAAGSGYYAARLWPPAAPAAAPAMDESRQGQPAPDIRIADLDGRPRSLAEWRGRWLLVNFWASWCAPCMEEIPLLIASQTRYAPRGLQVLGIAMDDPEAVRATVKEKVFNYPTLAGDEAVLTAMEQLGNTLGAIPYTVLISPDGVVREMEMGGINSGKIDTWMQQYLPDLPGKH